MKKFTKLFLSCAAVAAISAAIGVSAMAEDVTAPITGDVTGTVTITEAGAATVSGLTIADTPADNTQVTFLVFKGTADTDISADSVKGIDQGTTVQPTNSGLKSDVTVPAEGQETYTVKVGYYNASNTFTVKSGTFKLGEAAGEPFVLGDIDGNHILGVDGVGAQDAAYILRYATNGAGAKGDAGKKVTLVEDATANGVTVTAGTTIALGDVDGNHILGVDGVGAQDSAFVLRYATNNSAAKGLAGASVTATPVAAE